MKYLSNTILENAFANMRTINQSKMQDEVMKRIGSDAQDPDYRQDGYLHSHAQQLFNLTTSNYAKFGLNSSTIVG